MSQYWWLIALVCSLITAGYVYINQIFKMPGLLIMVYRGFMVGFLTLPFVLLNEPIHNWQFYAFCSAQGLAIAFNDYRLFRAIKVFGAEVSASIQPLAISVMFVFWLVITPAQFFGLLDHPYYFMAIVACLSGIIFAVIKLRNAKSSAKAFIYLLPVLIGLAIGDILNKKSMQYGAENLVSAIIYYSCITGFVCGFANLFVYLKRRQNLHNLFLLPNLKHGLIVALLVIILMVFKNLSMYLTPNPAYASAIILLYPLWIMGGNNIYCWTKGKTIGYARVDWKLLLLLLISVVGLVILTTHI